MIKEMFSDTESFKSNIKLKINAVLIELKTVVKNYLSLGSRASLISTIWFRMSVPL